MKYDNIKKIIMTFYIYLINIIIVVGILCNVIRNPRIIKSGTDTYLKRLYVCMYICCHQINVWCVYHAASGLANNWFVSGVDHAKCLPARAHVCMH